MLLWEILNLKQFCQHKNFQSASVFPSTWPRFKATMTLVTLQRLLILRSSSTTQFNQIPPYLERFEIKKRKKEKLNIYKAQVMHSLDDMETR